MSITEETLAEYDRRFPPSMPLYEVAEILDHMDPDEARPFDEILCNYICNKFYRGFLSYSEGAYEKYRETEFWDVLRKRSKHLPPLYVATVYISFVEHNKVQFEADLRDLLQANANELGQFTEDDIALFFAVFKNAYPGFWSFIKGEIMKFPHHRIVEDLCDVFERFSDSISLQEKLQNFEEAYQRHPDSSIVNETLGILYYDERLYGNAIAAFERIYLDDEDLYDIRIYSQADIHFFLGYANDRMKNRASAIEHYEKAVEYDPYVAYAANNLGYLYYRNCQYEKAYAILKRCLDEELVPDLSYPANNLARVLYAAGRYKEAKEFLRTSPVTVSKPLREKIEKAPNRDVPSSRKLRRTNLGESEATPKYIGERKSDQFQSERLLEEELILRMETGVDVFGIPLRIYHRKGEYGRQYIFAEGRLDILAEDEEGNLYIIELKKDAGYADAYKQIVEYVEWFQKHKAPHKKVFGILCMNDPKQDLIDTIRKDERIKLFEYQISYTEIN